jgi:ABC-type Fe3+-hydroxamate transport system substrate-binding protein
MFVVYLAAMTIRVLDDRQRELVFIRPPRRIVSLVPSDTLNVKALGLEVVGRTRYCDGDAAVVGGTKDVDVDAVARLEPDLILANQEENSRVHLEELARLELPILISFPKTVADGIAHLARLAKILQAERGRELIRRGYAMLSTPIPEPPLTAFVPIWMEPLMTVNRWTFISDALRLAGAENAFADRERRFPLAADLGQAVPTPAGTRDTRYPRVTFDEVVERKPALILLPDEPHPFSEEDAAVFRARVPGARVVRCGGRDFSWYGAQSIEGIPRLRELVGSRR